jgi:glycosyltransferase involved in cell wall biosynthesis
MRVTIITACYNRAATIGEAIVSVASQSYGDIEHVVVDGGSTDGTLEVIDRHRASIDKLIPGPDKGIYDALNKGLAACTGDLVGFLHSDDFYANREVIGMLVDEVRQGKLDAIYGDVAYVRPEDTQRVVRVFSSRRFRPDRIAWGWMPAHPALFVSRRLYERFGPYKTDYEIGADFEFVARIFSHADFRYAYVPKVLVKMRTGGVSTRGLHSTITLNREIRRACRENGIPTNYLKIYSKYPAKLLELVRREA